MKKVIWKNKNIDRIEECIDGIKAVFNEISVRLASGVPLFSLFVGKELICITRRYMVWPEGGEVWCVVEYGEVCFELHINP